MKGISKFLLPSFTFLIFFVIALPADAQNRDFQKANTFLQQQNYEEALPIFRELHQNDPTAYIFFERLTETLINLHEYEEAIEITEYQIENNHSLERSKIRLAEIHHLSGDKELAHTTWNEVYQAMTFAFKPSITLPGRCLRAVSTKAQLRCTKLPKTGSIILSFLQAKWQVLICRPANLKMRWPTISGLLKNLRVRWDLLSSACLECETKNFLK